jgi:hypothetical protein
LKDQLQNWLQIHSTEACNLQQSTGILHVTTNNNRLLKTRYPEKRDMQQHCRQVLLPASPLYFIGF